MDRRNFLKNLGVLIGAVAVVPRLLLMEPTLVQVIPPELDEAFLEMMRYKDRILASYSIQLENWLMWGDSKEEFKINRGL